jgi:hypothetical protein
VKPQVALVGSGSLAAEIAYGLAELTLPGSVTLVARDRSAAARICVIASLRAQTAASGTTFEVAAGDDVAAVVAGLAPEWCVLAASRHSPWEHEQAPSAWTRAVGAAGVALTLPLHASLALQVGRAVAASGGRFVNACLPDLVNPLLDAAAVPVLTGLGNAGVLVLAARNTLGLGPCDLRVLAHHVHLDQPSPDVTDAIMITRSAGPVDVAQALRPLRDIPRRERNQVTGRESASVVAALVTGSRMHTALPGPAGLPGGYSVRLEDGRIDLLLPDGWTRCQAIEQNQRWSWAEGAIVKGSRVVVADHVRAAVAAADEDLVSGFDIGQTELVARGLSHVRARLRRQPERDPGD